jgi:putative hydrolase of the HAD superfamily
MGRRTFESIGHPLSGRKTIVLSRRGFVAEGVLVASTLEESLTLAEESDTFICGGSELYREALPLCRHLFITRIEKELPGDTFFPQLPTDTFVTVATVPLMASPRAEISLLQRMDALWEIRVVALDFGGVIADEGFREGLYHLAKISSLDPQTLHSQAMDAIYDSGYAIGRGSEESFWRLLAERSGLRGDPAVLRQEILSRFRLRPKVLEAVALLRQRGYRTAIISDQTDWLEELDRQHPFSQHFDLVINSYRHGSGKRQPAIFTDTARMLGVAPRQILFIDDVPANLLRAGSKGLCVRQATTSEEFLQVVAALDRTGSNF